MRSSGFAAFSHPAQRQDLKMALRNSIVWTITIVAIQYILALFIALLLNQDFPGRSIFRDPSDPGLCPTLPPL